MAKANEPVLGVISGHLVCKIIVEIGMLFAKSVPVTTAESAPELIIAICIVSPFITVHVWPTPDQLMIRYHVLVLGFIVSETATVVLITPAV